MPIMRTLVTCLVAGAVLAAAAGCSAEAGTPASATVPAAGTTPGTPAVAGIRHYKIRYSLLDDAPPATVTAGVPAGWKEQLDPTGAPTFTLPSWTGAVPPAIVAYPAGGATDPAVRIEDIIALQYGPGAPGVSRSPLPGGRVWTQKHENSSPALTGLHVCLFIGTPGGVVAAVAVIPDSDAGRLPEVRTAFESITVS
jgi:hypothetical protein